MAAAVQRAAGGAAIRTERLDDLAVDGLAPTVSVRPEEPDQVAAILAACAEIGASVAPRGAGTQLAQGHPPDRVDVVLETLGLNRVLDYNPADLTLGAQAGVRLAELQARLSAEGQFLPLDPPFADDATVGGLVATNTSGPRRVLSGSWRDLVIGAEVASPDGQVTKSGGMVVKNVTGYDVHKAHIGALGTLGVLTRVNLKIAPLPQVERTVVFGFDDVLAGGAAVGELVASGVTASGIDLIARELLPEPIANGAPWVLAVRLSGTAEGVDARLASIASHLPRAGTGRGEELDGAAQDALWRSAVAVAEPPPGGEPHAVCRFSALSSQVGSLLGSAREIAEGSALTCAAAAHAVSGVGRVRLSGSDDPAALIQGVTKLRDAVEHLGGRLVVEAAPAEMRRRLDVWGFRDGSVTLDAMRSLRRAFDPRGTINPGRFVTDTA